MALNFAAARLRHIAGTAWSCHHRVSLGRASLSQNRKCDGLLFEATI